MFKRCSRIACGRPQAITVSGRQLPAARTPDVAAARGRASASPSSRRPRSGRRVRTRCGRRKRKARRRRRQGSCAGRTTASRRSCKIPGRPFRNSRKLSVSPSTLKAPCSNRARAKKGAPVIFWQMTAAADADVDRFALGLEPDSPAQASAVSHHGLALNRWRGRRRCRTPRRWRRRNPPTPARPPSPPVPRPARNGPSGSSTA